MILVTLSAALAVSASHSKQGQERAGNLSDISFSQNDITASPATPRVGDNVLFGLRLHNGTARRINGVRVQLYVGGRSMGSATVNLGPQDNVHANSFSRWSAVAGRTPVQFKVTHKNMSRDVTGTATVENGGQSDLDDLSCGRNDVTADPSRPQAGDRVLFGLRIRNVGGSQVNDVKVTLLVGGQMLGVQTIGRIKAGVTYHAQGFRRWDAVSGKTAVKFIVTCGGQRREVDATADVGGGGDGNNGDVRDITVNSNDVTADPERPRAADRVRFGIKLHNYTDRTLRDIKVTLYVGNSFKGSKTITLRRGQTTHVDDFSTWTAVSGKTPVTFTLGEGRDKRTISATASVDGGGGGGNTPSSHNVWLLETEPKDVTAEPRNPRPGNDVRFGLYIRNNTQTTLLDVNVKLVVGKRTIGERSFRSIKPGEQVYASGYQPWRAVAGQTAVEFVIYTSQNSRSVHATADVK